MDKTESPPRRYLTVRQAAFIGVGAGISRSSARPARWLGRPWKAQVTPGQALGH